MTGKARQALSESRIILAAWCLFCALVISLCAPAYLTSNSSSTTPENAPENAPESVAMNAPWEGQSATSPEDALASVTSVEGPSSRGADQAAEVSIAGATSESVAAVPTVLGMPRWVFWGIAMPWLAASVFTIVFALRGIQVDPPEAKGQEPFDHA